MQDLARSKDGLELEYTKASLSTLRNQLLQETQHLERAHAAAQRNQASKAQTARDRWLAEGGHSREPRTESREPKAGAKGRPQTAREPRGPLAGRRWALPRAESRKPE